MNNRSKFLFLAVMFFSILAISYFFHKKGNFKVEPKLSLGKLSRVKIASYPPPLHIQKKIIYDEDGLLSSDLEQGYDLSPFKGVSDNEQALELFAHLSNNPNINKYPGLEIRRGDDEDLYLDDIKLFTSNYIYSQDISNNGIIAIEAITKSEYHTYKNPSIDFDSERKFFPVNYGEIWIVAPNEKPFKISPEFLSARSPRISGDGRKVAFSANAIDKTNSLILSEFVVVYDLTVGSVEYFGSENMKLGHYSVSPVMWLNEDKVLRVIEDWGETGGHAQVGYVDLR